MADTDVDNQEEQEDKEVEAGRMTFGEHLEALRRHLIRGLLGIGLIMLVTL